DRSVFTGLPILQALRRDQIVGMQIEPWGPQPGSHEVDFCGRPTRFQLGPFAVARVARAPIVPVFARRTGIRRYEVHVVGRFDPRTPAESVAALEATVCAYGTSGWRSRWNGESGSTSSSARASTRSRSAGAISATASGSSSSTIREARP